MFKLSYLLLAIAILSALLFGSVEVWSIAFIGLLTAVVFISFVKRFPGLAEEDTASKHITFSIILIFAYGILQLIPLPVSILNMVHPKVAYLFSLPPSLQNPVPAVHAATLVIPPTFHAVSVYPFATEQEVARIVIYLMVFCCAAFGLESKKDVYSVLKTLAVFGFILCLFGLIQKTAWNGKIYWFRTLSNPRSMPFASFVNKNDFAGWINMIIPISLGIGLMAKTIHKKVRYLFFAVAMSVILFYSLSRGGVISFFAGIFAFACMALHSKVSKKKLIPFFLFIVALSIFLIYVGVSPILHRFANVDISTEERIIVWKATFGAFTDFSVFGSGLGTFSHIFSMYHPPTWWYYDYAHNDYLQFLLEAGIAGAIVFGMFLFLVARTTFTSEWTERESYLKAGLVASVTTLAVHSIFDFNLHIPSNAILFSLILGLAVALSRLNTDFE